MSPKAQKTASAEEAKPETVPAEVKPPKPVRVKVGNLPVFHEGEYLKPGTAFEVHAERAQELAATGHVTPEKEA